jgi:hypothetical protein
VLTLLFLSLVAQVKDPSGPPWMNGESRPEDLRISLVTFSPGDSLTEWWGHSALVVEDTSRNQARLYNYGMFSFSEGFVRRFAKGRLEFWVSDDSMAGTYRLYQQLQRDVRIQELDLTPAEALQVAGTLGTVVLPQNRNYLYQHYRDNCSTRPRDVIDAALQGQLKEATKRPARMTLREHTLRYSMVNPPMSLVLDFLQNDELDQPMMQQQEAYLPDELERQVQAFNVRRVDGSLKPLVRRQWTFYLSTRTPPPETAPRWTSWLLFIGTLTAGVMVWLAGRAQVLWARLMLGLFTALFGLMGGILGLGLFVLSQFTDHTVTYRNENLFLLNPLTLGLFPLGLQFMFSSQKAPQRLAMLTRILLAGALFGLALKVLPSFDQNNLNLSALLMPILLSQWWLFRKLKSQHPERV